MAEGWNDPMLWRRVADAIGPHPYTYDLDDESHRLDVVQIVCEAIAKVSEDAAPSQIGPTPSDTHQSGPHAFGSPEVGYAVGAGGSTTWPESTGKKSSSKS